MKKYKLIKELPFENSPKIGYISIGKFGHRDHYWNGNWFNPQNYPEFWELVVEKDYEILNLFFDGHFYELSNKKLNKTEFKYLSKTIDGHCGLTDLNIKFEDSEMNVKIHSIKRKSDGEIFTISDKIRFIDESLEETYPCRIIKSFKIKDNTIISICDDNGVEILLKNLKHVKQPLFTTEDGVDIFESDYYYPVEKLYYFLHEKQKDHHCTNEDKFWIFSTKEKAEEYILMNKHCLSLNNIFKDVEEMRKGLKTFENSQLAKRFKKLVQQKLNNNN